METKVESKVEITVADDAAAAAAAAAATGRSRGCRRHFFLLAGVWGRAAAPRPLALEEGAFSHPCAKFHLQKQKIKIQQTSDLQWSAKMTQESIF